MYSISECLISLKYMWQKQPTKVFCKKGVLRNFTKFTGKHLCQSLFFNKVAGLRAATLLKKRLGQRCFPVNFAKFLKTLFLQNTSVWLLLMSSIFELWSELSLYKKGSFPLRISSVNVSKSTRNCGSVRFTEDILNGNLHFLCSVSEKKLSCLSKEDGIWLELYE